MSTTLANEVRNQCSVIRDSSEEGRWRDVTVCTVAMLPPGNWCNNSLYPPLTQRDDFIFTYIVLLQQAVKGGQVLDNELAKDPLVCLDAQQRGGEVGGREEVFDQGTHHP